MKIEKQSDGKTTIIRFVGRIRAKDLEEIQKQLRDTSQSRVLDLSEVTIVDAEVIRLLSASEQEGTRLVGCPAYVREWILRERAEE